MYHLLLIYFFFLFKLKSCFSILSFAANYMYYANYVICSQQPGYNHFMFSAASIESACLNWMLILVLFVLSLVFL